MAKKIFKTGSGKTTYRSDVTDEEWAFCAPYLTLMKEEAPQREHSLRRVFHALRYMVRAGCPWHLIPKRFSAVVDCLPADAAVDRRRLFCSPDA